MDHPTLRLDRFRAALSRKLDVEGQLWNLLAMITNVLTPSGDRPPGDEDSSLAETVGAALAATLSSAAPPATMPRSSLHADALRIIDGQHRDATVSVTTLAQRLSISVPHVHRLFAHAGSRPRDAIEERRVSTALALRQLDDGELDENDIVTRSGFTSVRRMREAIRRQHGGTASHTRRHDSPL